MKAFPYKDKYNDYVHQGMDLRDYFAAKAMQAILVTPLNREVGGSNLISKTAYEYADAMMEARNVTK